ncbi:hypothetical protein [Aureivirga sp. CE67]|uniref:hypothetical protein n=1 Tax=Aureivirga sp. CE67 TaxID=1788983 RepID=UPI0018C9CFE3|nr:hypothetical protein [Aureivirga sp. CE67]
MKLKLFFLLFINSIVTFAQITFEKGYFINNDNEKVECLIKNVDWKNTPTEFFYKTSENGEVKKETIDNVKEFSVLDKTTFKRFQTDIDVSLDDLRRLDNTRNPKFENRTIFLKEIISGKANLYIYEEPGLKRFFLEKEDLPITQLIYKRFRINSDYNKIRENNYFKQQLKKHLICADIKVSKLERAVYHSESLSKIFIDYNYCGKEKEKKKEINKVENKAKTKFHFSVIPSFKLTNPSFEGPYYTFKNQYMDEELKDLNPVQIGVELEMILPFNNGKWGAFINPNFRTASQDLEFELDKAEIKMNILEINVGFRHYMYLSKKSKLFINGMLSHDIYFNSYINFEERPKYRENLDLESGTGIAAGVGFKFLDKFSGEVRYYSNKDFLRNHIHWKGTSSSLSILFGYTIF